MKTRNPKTATKNEAGAFDLPSILTGVVVVGVLTAGVLASVHGVIPFAQDEGSRQDLSAVQTAQGTAKAQQGIFLTQEALNASGLVAGLGDRIEVTSSNGAEFCATSLSPTGKLFSITESMSGAMESNICDSWDISDPALRASVIAELDGSGGGVEPVSFMTPAGGSLIMIRTSGEPERRLTLRDAEKITHLDLTGSGVNSLEGIQEAVNLKTLILDGTAVTNIAPLVGLAELESVDAMEANIPDWSPINHVATVNALWSVPDAESRRLITEALGVSQYTALTIADARALESVGVLNNLPDYSFLKVAFNAKVGANANTNEELAHIRSIPNLTSLSLEPGVTDVGVLAGLTKLESIQMHNTTVQDISALTGMTSMKIISLPETVSNFSALGTMTGLETLPLPPSLNMTDLSSIAGLTKLKHLQVPHSVSDFSAIANFHSLEELNLTSNPNLTSFAQFAGLENLKTVWAEYTPASDAGYATDWSPLGHVGSVSGRPANTNLTAEQLQAAWDITDPYLREAVAMEVGKAPEDLIIADATNLRMLWLQGEVASLEGLQYAGNLRDLSIAFTSVSDLSPLAGLMGLQMLDAYGTMVTDWSPVAHIQNVMGRP